MEQVPVAEGIQIRQRFALLVHDGGPELIQQGASFRKDLGQAVRILRIVVQVGMLHLHGKAGQAQIDPVAIGGVETDILVVAEIHREEVVGLDTGVFHLDFLAEEIVPLMLTVQVYLHEQIGGGPGHAGAPGSFESDRIAKQRPVQPVGQQDVLLALTGTQQVRLLVQLEVIRLLRMVPGGVSATSDRCLLVIEENLAVIAVNPDPGFLDPLGLAHDGLRVRCIDVKGRNRAQVARNDTVTGNLGGNADGQGSHAPFLEGDGRVPVHEIDFPGMAERLAFSAFRVQREGDALIGNTGFHPEPERHFPVLIGHEGRSFQCAGLVISLRVTEVDPVRARRIADGTRR